MSLRNVGLVYRKELLESLRDRRTLMSTILIPLLKRRCSRWGTR